MMPRARLTSALFLAVVLIVGAMWFRFGKTDYTSSSITPINEHGPLFPDETFLGDFTGGERPTTTSSSLPLTQTDLFSRQLFSDYISLKSQGEITSSDANNIASKYAQNLFNISVPANKISINQITIVPDSQENLSLYGNAVSNLIRKYKNLTASQYGGGSTADISSPAFATFMIAVSKSYQAAANELIALKAPASLAENHLNFVNLYLENAEIMKVVSSFSQDPVPAYSALNSYVQNTGKESGIILNIRVRLQASGIIFNNSL